LLWADGGAVLAAAVTALVVTAVVEYFAKPTLEARKERILEQLRARRTLMRLIVELSEAAALVAADVPKFVDQDAHDRCLAERRRCYARMIELTQETVRSHIDAYAVSNSKPR
jgi:H2-forming N5,N10-methylenetetrahydromethanopterin dehydrogenase-like enzyme